MEDKNLKFVVEHYQDDVFNRKRSWMRLGLGKGLLWSRIKIVASVALIIAISATATVLINKGYFISDHEDDDMTVPTAVLSPADVVRTIEFDNASLPDVLDDIRIVYGVEITNVPADADQYHITLRYEGSARDLVDAINDLLDLKLIVEE